MKRTEGAELLEPSFGAGIATARCLCRGPRRTQTVNTVNSVNPSRLVVTRRASALAFWTDYLTVADGISVNQGMRELPIAATI